MPRFIVVLAATAAFILASAASAQAFVSDGSGETGAMSYTGIDLLPNPVVWNSATEGWSQWRTETGRYPEAYGCNSVPIRTANIPGGIAVGYPSNYGGQYPCHVFFDKDWYAGYKADVAEGGMWAQQAKKRFCIIIQHELGHVLQFGHSYTTYGWLGQIMRADGVFTATLSCQMMYGS